MVGVFEKVESRQRSAAVVNAGINRVLIYTYLKVAWAGIVEHLLHVYRVLAQPFEMCQRIIAANVNHRARGHSASQLSLNFQAESLGDWLPQRN